MKLLCWHGWAMQPGVFEALAEALPGWQLEAPALQPEPGESLALWATRLASGIDDSTLLLGWSLGAQLALSALGQGARPAGLVLIGASPRFVNGAGWQHGLYADTVRGFTEGLASSPQRTLQRFLALQAVGDTRRADTLRSLGTQIAAPDSAALAPALALLAQTDLRRALHGIECPSLLLHGGRDALMPVAAAHWLVQVLHNASLWVLEDCGHAPHVSQPGQVARHIAHFAAELG